MSSRHKLTENLFISVGEFDPEDIAVHISYTFHPYRRGSFERGGRQIEPDEPEFVEITDIKLTPSHSERPLECPGWLYEIITEKLDLDRMLLRHAMDEIEDAKERAAEERAAKAREAM